MVEYKLRTGALLADMTAAPGMIARGKLAFLPHAIEGDPRGPPHLRGLPGAAEEDA